MNSIFSNYRDLWPRGMRLLLKIGIALVAVLLVQQSVRTHAQNADISSAQFRSEVTALSTARLNGGAESEGRQEKALAYLDAIVISVLNSSSTPDLDGANQKLAALVSHTPPVGENYHLLKIGESPAAYALVVNFGLGGPAAVRIYAGAAGRFDLAAGIDHFSRKDFFDSDIELVPVSMTEMVFVTVGGRTDDLATGMFSAWRFDGHRAVTLWTSDLLQQSNYEADAAGFHLTYCGQPDEDHPSNCLKMTRDIYRYGNGEWKRVETADLPPAKLSSK